MSRIRLYGPTVVLLLTLAAVMLVGPSVARKLVWAQTDAQAEQARKQLENNESLKNLSQSFRQVAQAVEPSVVHIQILSYQDPQQRGRMSEEMLRRFFGPDLEERFGPQSPDERSERDGRRNPNNVPQERGNGSGWVYDSKGHIVTNYHVVAQADKIRVRFHDGTERVAEVVGTDPKTDVAVLKVEKENLHPAVVADLNENPIQQGEMVFAFGSPFRFDFSMSQGIVSAKGRQLGIIQSRNEQTGQLMAGYENFIQTDAAINPGNSGGPLTNIRGQVIGMNTAIASRTGTYNGIGFATPVSMITDVADQLINEGEVSRGFIGVQISDLTESMAQTFNYDSADGVLVTQPIAGTPGAEAGLKAGDIITHLKTESMSEKQPVATADELRTTIAGLKPGTRVMLTVFRQGETMTKTVTLGELGEAGQQASGGDTPQGPQMQDGEGEPAQGSAMLRKLGIESVATFSQRLAQQLGVKHQPGVIIRAVRSQSVADAQGLQKGMIITHVMGERIQSSDQLVQAFEQRGADQPVRLRVMQWDPRQDQFLSRFVALSLPAGASQ